MSIDLSVGDVIGYALTIIFGIVGIAAGYKVISNRSTKTIQNKNTVYFGDITGGDKVVKNNSENIPKQE